MKNIFEVVIDMQSLGEFLRSQDDTGNKEVPVEAYSPFKPNVAFTPDKSATPSPDINTISD